MICGRCGADNPEGARFCNACGAPLAQDEASAREERRVVSCLFCDLVGFTARAEQLDPEDVRALQAPYWARLRGEIERFGGTVEKFVGDAVMALFGAPTAHEDDPERAARAALAIREAVRELNEADPGLDLHVRTAVATGEALVALGARPGEGEGMASGDVVNTAARLQGTAPVDGILVDGRTHAATERQIVYREVEPVVVKGKAEPVAVFEALEPRARVGVEFGRGELAPLVGRDSELGLLTQTLVRVRGERAPQLLTLVGVPGIGKSRLVSELFGVVEADPELIFWRQGRSLPYGEGVTYWALGEMVKAQAGILETDAAAETEAKLRASVSDFLPDSAEARWVEGHLRPLVGLSEEGAREDRRSEAFAAWRRFLEALAERGPTVLVFEDLHWADEGLLDFVDYLADWASDVPLLVLGTARPELLSRRPAWGGGKPNAFTLSLSPLSDEDTARLLSALVDRTLLPAETQQALLTRAGGNPLYAEEYARLLRDSREADELPLPESVQGIIAARLDHLSAAEKELLQDASVVGKVFWLGALESMTATPRFVLEERLHGLERREFLRRDRRSSVAGESEYAFRHALVREVSYGQIPRAGRAEKHRAAAAWIESLSPDRAEEHAEMLAHHYLEALRYAKAAGHDVSGLAGPARQALREAGDRALALNAFAPAKRFYDGALELWPENDPERARILLRCGRATYERELGGEELLVEARDGLLAAGEKEAAAEAEIMLGIADWRATESAAAWEHFRRAGELVAGRPSSLGHAYVLSSLSRFHMLAGQYEDAIVFGRQALVMAEELGLDELRAHALNNIGCSRTLGGDRDGIADLERSVEIALSANSPEAQRCYTNLAAMVAGFGDFRRCRVLHRRALEVAERFGVAGGILWCRAELVADAYAAGDWEEAERCAKDFLDDVTSSGSAHYQEPLCLWVRALIDLARGRLDSSLEGCERAVEIARRASDPQALLPALAMQGYALVLAGRNEPAGRVASELLALHEQTGHWLGAEITVQLAATLAALGRAEEYLAATEAVKALSPLIEAARAYAAGDYLRAADLYDEIGSLPNEALCRLKAAEALIAAGRRPEGEEELRRALAFWRSVGATAYIRQGEALLAASA